MFNLSKYKSDFQRNRILAVPIILGQLGQTAVNIADNLMVGKLGADALAAVSFATALFAVPFVGRTAVTRDLFFSWLVLLKIYRQSSLRF